MQQANRHFGSDIQNIVNNNHIVLRSSSFSFENKRKIYVNPDAKTLVRRQSVATQYQPKNYLVMDFLKKKSSDYLAVSEKQSIKQEEKHQFLQNLQNDLQSVPNYVKLCIDHLLSRQAKNKIDVEQILNKNPGYIAERANIVDWLAKVHGKLRLFQQTFIMAVTYMDKFLSKQTVDSSQCQLIGLVCLLIASKFEETYQIPKIETLIKTANLKVQPKKVIQVEDNILSQLGFQLIEDSPVKFAQLFSKIANLSRKNECIVQYFIQMAIMDINFMEHPASKLAASTIYLIHKIRKLSPAWLSSLKSLTGYSESDLKACSKMLCKLMEKDNPEFGINIRRKFSKEQFCCASTVRITTKTQ